MANNPNDINKLVNEVLKTLQDASNDQLDSAESFVSAQKDIKKKQDAIKTKEAKLEKKKATQKLKQDKAKDVIDKKNLKFQLFVSDMLKSEFSKVKQTKVPTLDRIVSKLGFENEMALIRKYNVTLPNPVSLVKGLFSKKEIPKKKTALEVQKELIISESKMKNVKFNINGNFLLNSSKVGLQNKQQSKNDPKEDLFRTDNETPEEEQIKILRSINNKLGAMSSGSGNGLFDFLLNGLPKILSTVASIAQGGAGALAGAGAAGALGKYSKWFKLPKIGKSLLEGGSKLLSKAKSPMGLAVLGTASLASGGYAAYKSATEEEPQQTPEGQPIEGRAKGGPVKRNKPYVVGENGPELFAPDSNGSIVPRMMANGITIAQLKAINKEQSVNNDRKIGSIFESFTKPFTKNLKAYSGKVTSKIGSFVDVFKEGWDVLSEKIKGVFYSIKEWISSKLGMVVNAPTTIINGGKNLLNAGKNFVNGVIGNEPTPQPQTATAPSTTPSQTPSAPSTGNMPQNYHGAFDVPKTGPRKIHDGEMIIPAFQAEMVRAASELKSTTNIPRPVENSPKMKLTEEFWMGKFVPAFAAAIKVDRRETVNYTKTLSTVNPFG